MLASEIIDAIQDDFDLHDEKFISQQEVIRAINKSLKDMAAVVSNMYEDYFLDFQYMPIEPNKFMYDLPHNIFANKIRRITYSKESLVYSIDRISDITFAEGYKQSVTEDIYPDRYMLINDKKEGVRARFYPVPDFKATFTYAKELAEWLREELYSHYQDIELHFTTDNTVISDTKIIDKNLLFDAVNNLTNVYYEHQLDSEQTFGWNYHIGQSVDDPANSSRLSSVKEVNSLSDAIKQLNDIYYKLEAHRAEYHCHTDLVVATREANKIRDYLVAHLPNIDQHLVADLTPIDMTVIIDEATLLAVTDSMTGAYVTHQADSLLPIPVYHTDIYDPATMPDEFLVSAVPVVNTEEAIIRNRDIYAKLSLHSKNSETHNIAVSIDKEDKKVVDTNINILIYYIRKPNEVIDGTTVIDFPEFSNYLISKAKMYLLDKDIGNPVLQKVMITLQEQKDLMLQTLETRIPDDFNDEYIRESPYDDSMLID